MKLLLLLLSLLILFLFAYYQDEFITHDHYDEQTNEPDPYNAHEFPI